MQFDSSVLLLSIFLISCFINQISIITDKGPFHTGSSRADFNHGLVVHPQGCLGCQKIHKNILQMNLLTYCANIQPLLKKLQKTSKSHQKRVIFGRTSQFCQVQLNISAINFQIQVCQVLPVLLTPIRPLVAYNQWRYLSFYN